MNRRLIVRVFEAERELFKTKDEYITKTLQELYDLIPQGKRRRPMTTKQWLPRNVKNNFWIVCPRCEVMRASLICKDAKIKSLSPENIMFCCKKCNSKSKGKKGLTTFTKCKLCRKKERHTTKGYCSLCSNKMDHRRRKNIC